MKQTSLSGYVISEEPKFLLATSPPTMMQRRLALGVTATLLLIFALTAPFATIQLPRIDAFISILQILFFVIRQRPHHRGHAVLPVFVQPVVSDPDACERVSVRLFHRGCAYPHLPRPVLADRTARRGPAKYRMALFLLAPRLCRSRPAVCVHQGQRAKQGPHAIDTKDNRVERCIGVRAGVRIHMAQHGQGALSFSPIHRARP